MEQLIRKPAKENEIRDLVLNIEWLFSYKILNQKLFHATASQLEQWRRKINL